MPETEIARYDNYTPFEDNEILGVEIAGEIEFALLVHFLSFWINIPINSRFDIYMNFFEGKIILLRNIS